MDKEAFLTNFSHIQITDFNGFPTPYFITVDITNKPDAPSYEWLADNVICMYRNDVRLEFSTVNTIVKSMKQDFITKIHSQCFPTTKGKK